QTQYLTQSQGMPLEVAKTLEKILHSFMWEGSRLEAVSKEILSMKHEAGGKKLLDLQTRNDAVALRDLAGFVNFGPERPAWAYVVDMLVSSGLSNREQVGSPLLQSWKMKVRRKNVPYFVKEMLRAAKKYGLTIQTVSMSTELLGEMPTWHHPG
ncbi:hypothetical protein BDN71DRAFT_1352124, partial [Pleurotus eryngii]